MGVEDDADAQIAASITGNLSSLALAVACHPGLFHCLDAIVDSIFGEHLCTTMVWACSFLGMVAPGSSHHRISSHLLRVIYTSCLLDFSTTSKHRRGFASQLFIVAEIEALMLHRWGEDFSADIDVNYGFIAARPRLAERIADAAGSGGSRRRAYARSIMMLSSEI